ncbi:MAG TPA: MobF family relaxase [Nocardioides sp.]|uniref:MobF family relaxase n=1 Tax=Nocardioides sp. TaxID=35761 RepID=UPI002E30AC3A|nr:MobF family relaxase [Nocardioides sp.]HEX5086366.1 MobF family relaxase [Nocardioides sp.]
MKIYRGSPVAARCYVEADRARVDDYYLAEGTGLANRHVATPDGVVQRAAMDGDTYERWVAGFDVETGTLRDRKRADGDAVRFVEVVINGPKSWSLAAAVHPEIAQAYDAAQGRAAVEIIGWLAKHATTRMGPQNRQVQVPVEVLEAVVVAHQASRARDPHRHLHLQVNTRVWAHGAWRGLHTVGVRDSLAAINGIGTAAIACDPQFRAALARYGYRIDGHSEIAELAPYVGAFSARASQITRTMDRYEAQWRGAHPGQEPGPRVRQRWHAGAWAEDRPDKITPTDGTELTRAWVEQLHALGFRPPLLDRPLHSTPIGALDRDRLVDDVLARLGAARSAWNAADIRGEVERTVAAAGVIAAGPVRAELTEDLTSRALEACVPLLAQPDPTDVPEHVRNLTSDAVLEVEADLTTRLTNRAQAPVTGGHAWPSDLKGLDPTQKKIARAMAGDYQLLVVEGAAGAGKTATLKAAARSLVLRPRGGSLTVVTPTRKAAQVASTALETAQALTAMQLAYAHGFRKDPQGRWSRTDQRPQMLEPGYLWRGSVLLVDEAGMLDQNTAHALLTIADENRAQVVLMGDRHQLPAVGRGGVLDLAVRWTPLEAHLCLETVHRFTDHDYAALTLLMRTGERPGEVFDTLAGRGQIILYPSEVERLHALSTLDAAEMGLLVADSREQVAALNAATRDHRLTTGHSDPTRWLTTDAGERIGVGDLIATRRNDRDLDIANRDTWTITAIGADGTLRLRRHTRNRVDRRSGECRGERAGERTIPAAYARQHVELAYATTAHGAQGETVNRAHLVIGDHTSAASAYVAMTRGRHRNTAHLVATSLDQARQRWIEVFTRDRADLGATHAANLAAEDIERYGSMARIQAAALRARRAPEPQPQPANLSEHRGSGPSIGP